MSDEPKRAKMRCAMLYLGCVLAAACQDWEEDRFKLPYEYLPPASLDSAVVFVESRNARAFVLDPSASELRPRVLDLARDPVLAVKRNGKDELLVLCRGERGAPGVAVEPAELLLVPAEPASPVRHFKLGSRFNALAQSDDGRYVVTHFGKGPSQGGSLFNPNQIAIVDLEAGPGAEPVARSIRSFGFVPTGVVFSPQMPLPEGPRALAVIQSDNHVTILDLTNPMRSEITVPLTLEGDRRTLRPVQVLFDPDARSPAIYVRAEGSDDIYVLRLVEVPAAERAANDFRPALSQVAAGRAPADMAIFDVEAPDGNTRVSRLLVVSAGSGDAHVIDARSSRSTRVALDAPATRIRVFEATAPGDPKPRRRALLLGRSELVGFLDLDRIEEQGGRNLVSQPMGAVATDALFLADRGLALVFHQAGAGAGGLSVIDLQRRTIAPIVAETPVGRMTLGIPSDKIWVAPGNGHILAFIELPAIRPDEVRLDAEIDAVLPVPGAGKVVVTHPGVAGHLTVLDADKPERAKARSAAGFLLSGLLGREDR